MMGAVKFLAGVWLLFFSMWPLLGSCGNSTGVDYKCGEEGVQLRALAGYLGGNVAFQIRDEFNTSYELQSCLVKCLLTTRGPAGESIFYAPYTSCLSVRKEEGLWLLRVRLVGRTKSEDLDLICPKPKHIRPRVIHHTPRPRTTPRSVTTTGYPGKTTESSVITGPPIVTPTTQADKGGKVTKPTEDRGTIEVTTIPPEVTSLGPPDLRTTLKSSDSLPPSQCKVPTGRIVCLNASVSRDTCLNNRCCHDPVDPISPCYYGHTVTVHCSPDGLFRLVLSRYATEPPLQLSSVVLGPGSCPSPTILGDFLEFQGYLSSCSGRRSIKGRLVYELSLTAKPDFLLSSFGSISRDSSFTILSQCLYNNALSNVSLVVLAPQLPTVTSTGILSVELRISKGSAFSSFYTSEDFPLPIPLRELVYLEARLLQPSDPRLHLRLHNCWGAPSLDPAVTLHWPVIDDGCPFSDDDTLTRILPTAVPSSYQRFAVSAFTFLNFQYNTQVYFFCSVSVCLPSPSESCTSDCANLTRGRRAHPDDLLLVGTAGPLVFAQEKTLGAAGLHHLTSTLPGIVFAVIFLLIVLLLVAALKVKSNFMMSKSQRNPQ